MMNGNLEHIFLDTLRDLDRIGTPAKDRDPMAMYGHVRARFDNVREFINHETDKTIGFFAAHGNPTGSNIPLLCAHVDTFFKTDGGGALVLVQGRPTGVERFGRNMKCAIEEAERLGHALDALMPHDHRYGYQTRVHHGWDCKVGVAMILSLLSTCDAPFGVFITMGEENGRFRRAVHDYHGDHPERFDPIVTRELREYFMGARVRLALVLDRHSRLDIVNQYGNPPRNLIRDGALLERIERAFPPLRRSTSPRNADAEGFIDLDIDAVNLGIGIYNEHNPDSGDILDFDAALSILKQLRDFVENFGNIPM